MARSFFAHRSSRVIAVCRVVMAALFVMWLWLEPSQPSRNGPSAFLLLGAYLALALALLSIAWLDWWLDFRLSAPAFFTDAAVFLLATYFTANGDADFVSPYIAFYTYLMLSAALRWSWSPAVLTAAFLCAGYLATGVFLVSNGFDVDLVSFLRRVTYMALLSLLLVWLTLRNRDPWVPRFSALEDEFGDSPLASALAFAMETGHARGAAIAWAQRDEPSLRLRSAGTLGDQTGSIAPDLPGSGERLEPMLFDTARRQALVLGEDDTYRAANPLAGSTLAQHLGVKAGLAVPLSGTTGQGELLLTGIEHACREDIGLARGIATEIARALDQEEASALARQSAMMRMRSNLARDLHDSVAQSLAGANFRLQALRGLIGSGGDPLPEIDAIHASMQAEQKQLRAMIQELRRNEITPGERELGSALAALLESLARQWKVSTHLDTGGRVVSVPVRLAFAIQQIVREGVGNAVRHGGAGKVRLDLRADDRELHLRIADDGSGFTPAAMTSPPRSIAERVESLGGKLAVFSMPGDTRLDITLPTREAP